MTEKTEPKTVEAHNVAAGIGKTEIMSQQPATQLPAVGEIQAMSPLQQYQQAKAMGMSIDEMREILALQKEWEENEARKAFYASLAEFKRNPPRVIKDRLNEKFGSDYVSIGNMVNTVNEAMGPFGLNASWEFPESSKPELIAVVCTLSHSMGYSISVKLEGPTDTEGSKNPIQARKSARTYLKLETFEAVTGMASISGNLDDDGNSAGKPKIDQITEEQALEIDAKIKTNELNMDGITDWLKKKYPYTSGNPDLLDKKHFRPFMAKIDAAIEQKRKQQEES